MPRFPGPKSRVLLKELARYVVAEPNPFVVDLEHSHGMVLITIDGDELFDWSGYYGSRLLGHNHRGLLEPDYQRRLLIAANNKIPNPDFLSVDCLEYYRLMYSLAPACMRSDGLEIYVVNSGAESVENMMKYLIGRHREKAESLGKSPQQRRFVYFERGFHGRTLGALNVTHLVHAPLVTKDFAELMPGNLRLPFPHLDNSRSADDNESEVTRCLECVRKSLEEYPGEIVAILVEPIQGAGGHRLALPRFFRELSALAAAHEVFLAFDEVQTAGGQCGSLFALDLFDLPYPPEAVAVAKKFGNGVLYMRQSLRDIGVLDSTWGGSLTDMVRVVQEFRIVEREGLMRAVAKKTERLEEGLLALEKRYPDFVFNVRGMGLYQGFSIREPADRDRLLTTALQHEQLLLLGAGGQSIRLRPPLDVSLEDINELLSRLERVLSSLADN